MKCPECGLDVLQVRILQETWAEPVKITLDGVALVAGAETETTFALICNHCGSEYELEGAEDA